MRVAKVVPGVVAAIAIDVLKLQRGVWAFAIEWRRSVAGWPHTLCGSLPGLLGAEGFLLDQAPVLVLLYGKIDPVLCALPLWSRLASSLDAFALQVGVVEEPSTVTDVLSEVLGLGDAVANQAL